jgi:hypothetical protein
VIPAELWMQPKTCMMFNVLMNRFQPGNRDTLLKYLPEADRSIIDTHRVDAAAVTPLLIHPELFIVRVDPTWLKAIFETEPPQIQNLFLNILGSWQREKLIKILNCSYTPLSLPQAIEPVIQKILFKKFMPKEILPLAFVKENEFSFLLNMEKSELNRLIDYLGIYDLAREFRESIDQKTLNTVYRTLSPDKRNFLDSLVKKKIKVDSAPISLNKLNGNVVHLNQLLTKRGLNRIGAALSGQEQSFLWHFSRLLDQPRATVLNESFLPPERIELGAPQYKEQLTAAHHFMQQG